MLTPKLSTVPDRSFLEVDLCVCIVSAFLGGLRSIASVDVIIASVQCSVGVIEDDINADATEFEISEMVERMKPAKRTSPLTDRECARILGGVIAGLVRCSDIATVKRALLWWAKKKGALSSLKSQEPDGA